MHVTTEDVYGVVEKAYAAITAARDHLHVNLLALDGVVAQVRPSDMRNQLLALRNSLQAVKRTLDDQSNELDVIAEPVRHAPINAMHASQ